MLVKRFSFSPKLATGEFQLSDAHRSGIAQWESDQLDSQQDFLERYSTIHRWFPELASYKAGQDPAPVLKAQRRVATDVTLVGGVYEAIKPANFPSTASVGPAWAVYRWVQIQLLCGLEYLRRYGPDRRDAVGGRVANDVVDSQYLATAVLADGLATGDDQIARFFRLLKPYSELRERQ